MKRNLLKKGIFGLFMLCGFWASSQIIYTDVDPDSTCISSSFDYFYFDMNNDNVDDFSINTYSNGVMSYIKISPESTDNEVLADAYESALALNSGEVINSSNSNWSDMSFAGFVYLNLNGQSGNWMPAMNKYLGVRVLVSGQWYYGWLKLSVPADASYFTVHEYAINSIPGERIVAGDITGIKEVSDNSFEFINNGNGFVTIKNSDNKIAQGNVRILNISGQCVYNGNMEDNTTVISTNGYSSGIYFLNITTKDQTQTIKFLL